MKHFLDTFMQTLSFKERESIGSVLQTAIVGKDQLESIIDRLGSLSNFQEIALATEVLADVIKSGNHRIAYRNIELSLSELFRMANYISLLLESHNGVLSQQIGQIEQEINGLEKMIDNYSFLLSDNAAFNYAYLEPFNDQLNTEVFDFTIPDRSGQVFTQAQQAIIDAEEGVLILTKSSLISSVPLTPSIVNSNVSSLVRHKVYLKRMLTGNHPEGWKYTVTSTSPIRTSVPEALNKAKGAQVVLNFDLETPTAVSQIRLTPSSAHNMEIVRVILYKSKAETEGVDLILSPETINKTLTLNFPLQTVARFAVIVNQATYERKFESEDSAERRYRELFELIDDGDEPEYSINNNFRSMYRIADILRNRPDRRYGQSALYRSILRNDENALRNNLGDFMRDLRPYRNTAQNNVTSAQLPARAMMELLYKKRPDLVRAWMVNDVRFRNVVPTQHQRAVDKPANGNDAWSVYLRAINSSIIGRFYKYSLGFQHVAIGIAEPGFKGVHVSKPLIADGDIGHIRMKTKEENAIVLNTQRDSNVVTSVEYSVSNISEPKSENDWIPILPIGQTVVTAERVFFDPSGYGSFRFPANRLRSIILYKNGIIVPIDTNGFYIYNPAGDSIIGIRIPNRSYSSNDIFTITYTPNSDYTTINLFEQSNSSILPLISVSDESGAGEFFLTTGARNTVVLSHSPHVNYDTVKTSQYSLDLGLYPYAPIIVKLANGSIATNLTNYTARLGMDTSHLVPLLPAASEGIYFYHSGNELIFNQEITSGFRVYYQYLEATLRVRTVLRVNSQDFVSAKVDFWHLKGKTRRSNLGNLI